MLFAYFSPEVTLPVASVIATLTGFVLACGRPVVSWIGRRLRLGGRKGIELERTAEASPDAAAVPTPPVLVESNDAHSAD